MLLYNLVLYICLNNWNNEDSQVKKILNHGTFMFLFLSKKLKKK